MIKNSAEKGSLAAEIANTAAIAVSQPQKLESLLDTINLLNSVNERIGEDRSGDMGGAGGSGGGQQGDDQTVSARDQAIANLPDASVMQKDLQSHIRSEVKSLRKELKNTTRHIGKPGTAYKLNELYKKIRRLNGVLKELLDSSVEVLERLYIRIFIDKQSVF